MEYSRPIAISSPKPYSLLGLDRFTKPVTSHSLAKNVLLTNTSWWACASRLAIGFGECGYYVSAVYPAQGHPLRKTSVIRQSFPYGARNPITSLKKAIRASSPDLVIPCDDRAVEHLHLLYVEAAGSGERDLTDLIERSLGNPASFSIAQSRSAVIEIAAESGVRVPATRQLRSLSDLKGIQDRGSSWVLKSDGSWGGHGVRMVHSREQAEAAYRELSRALPTARFVKRLLVDRDPYWLQTWLHRSRPAIVAQAFVKGRPANMIASCWRGELLDTISAEVVQAQGPTGSATVVRIVDSPEMVLAARILARRLELSGFFGLDFMIEEETGSCYLIEMNPRSTPLAHLALGMGRDPLAALAARLSGAAPSARQPVTQEDLIAYFPQAWHWDPNSEFLKISFCDVPSSEPELVKDLLQVPFPDRSLLARISHRLRREAFRDRRVRGGFFQAALMSRKKANEPPKGVPCRTTHP